MSNVVIVGCSRRKSITKTPIPAIDLYQGGYIPTIRKYVYKRPELRNQVYILSAKYGLLGANDPVFYYDQVLTMGVAKKLRPLVWSGVQERILKLLEPKELLIIAEPTYLFLIADLFGKQDGPHIYWEPDIHTESQLVATTLTRWKWNG